jgi:hypothetical protein
MNDREPTDNDFRLAHPDQWLKSEMDMRSYLRHKRIVETVGMIAVLAAILVAGFYHLIEGETIAALFGALVAYCFEHWRDKGKQV